MERSAFFSGVLIGSLMTFLTAGFWFTGSPGLAWIFGGFGLFIVLAMPLVATKGEGSDFKD